MAREHCEDKSGNMVSSAGFCYSDVSSSNPTIQTHLVNQIQGFESNQEIFNLTTGMEMIGFSKNLQQQSDGNSIMWKGFFGKSQSHPGPSSSKTINESTSDFYQDEFNKPHFTTGISETSSENLIVGAHDSGCWQENRLLVDDSSLRCVFPCEGNERPSQGLSLSLSSSNPSTIGVQSFELRHTNHHHQDQQDDMRFMASSSRSDAFYGKSSNVQVQQQMMQDGFLGKAPNLHQGHFHLRNSKYLVPAQELLNEFCSLGTKQTDPLKQKSHKAKRWEDENGASSSRKQALYSLDYMELQKRKTKLLSMLEEVCMLQILFYSIKDPFTFAIFLTTFHSVLKYGHRGEKSLLFFFSFFVD